MSNFGEKLENLLATRAEIISRMHRPPASEGFELLKAQTKNSCSVIDDVPPETCPVWPDEKAAAYSVIMPPIESFMNTAVPGDVLVGTVNSIQESGIVMGIVACDLGRRRDFDGLKLTGFVPMRQIPRHNHGNLTYILDLKNNGRLILSMNPKNSAVELPKNLKFGVISEEEMPLHYKKLVNLDNKTFEECLEAAPQFNNPDGLIVLSKRYGIPKSSACSLLVSYSQMRLPKSELAVELRKSQLRSLSIKHVAHGVKLFKEGKNTEALQCYNFAIGIEDTNADAYVARGALYASTGAYAKAISDLDEALVHKPNHGNAKNYLGQTLVAHANEMQRKNPSDSIELVKKALAINRNNNDARELLSTLTGSSNLSDEDGRAPLQPRGFQRERNAMAWSGSASPQERKRQREDSPNGGYQYGRCRKSNEQEHTRKVSKRRLSPAQRRSSSNEIKRTESPGNLRGLEQNNGNMDRNDLSKIVITRDRAGRTIRCSENNRESRFVRDKFDDQNKTQRRVYTPPKDVRVFEDGTMTKYENENDLPPTSKILQERVQAKLAAIERRHRGRSDEDSEASEYSDNSDNTPAAAHPPRTNIWAPPSSFDRRDRGNGNFYRGRGGRGGGGNNNYRGRGGGRDHRWEDRRRGGWRGGGGGNFRRGGYNHNNNNYNNRFRSNSRRSLSRSRSISRSRSRSKEINRSNDSSHRKNFSTDRAMKNKNIDDRRRRRRISKSSSRSPSIPPTNRRGKKSNVSRAVLESSDLPSLENCNRMSLDDHLGDVDEFVAQLKAKRQAQIQSTGSGVIGPQVVPSVLCKGSSDSAPPSPDTGEI